MQILIYGEPSRKTSFQKPADAVTLADACAILAQGARNCGYKVGFRNPGCFTKQDVEPCNIIVLIDDSRLAAVNANVIKTYQAAQKTPAILTLGYSWGNAIGGTVFQVVPLGGEVLNENIYDTTAIASGKIWPALLKQIEAQRSPGVEESETIRVLRHQVAEMKSWIAKAGESLQQAEQARHNAVETCEALKSQNQAIAIDLEIARDEIAALKSDGQSHPIPPRRGRPPKSTQ